MINLKPCPRCGSKNVELHGTKPGDTPWIFCRACGLLVDVRDSQGKAICNVERLVKKWNRRERDD
mgnify:CR=1 FL=1